MTRGDASRYLDAPKRLCALKIGGWSPHELHRFEPQEVERDKAEGIRRAYVAATRAGDRRVVPALGAGRWEGGWLGPLNRALYPPVASRRSAARGPKCPQFKSKDSVLQRPNDETAGAGAVSPGQSAFADGGHSVVWWDPTPGSGLTLDLKPTFGVRREDLIVKDVPKNVIADGRGRYDRWHLARDDARAAGAIPSMVVETVRDWTAAVEDGLRTLETVGDGLEIVPDAVDIIDVASREHAERPGGIAFGVLVHGVLAQAPFDASLPALADLASLEGRALGLSEEEAGAAASVVTRLFSHQLLRRARAADARGACRRETPVTRVLPDGTLIEGVVDLAFEEGGAWTVVDYKTDRELAAAGEDRYRRQVALYVTAIAQATGQRASGVLVRL